MDNMSRLGLSAMPFKCSECDFRESITKFLITNLIMLTLHQYFVYNYNRSSYIMYMIAHETLFVIDTSDYENTSCYYGYTHTAHGNGPSLENCYLSVVIVNKYYCSFIKHTMNITVYMMPSGIEVNCICLKTLILFENSNRILAWVMVIIPLFNRSALSRTLVFICKSHYGE